MSGPGKGRPQGQGYWAQVSHELGRNRPGMAGLAVIFLLLLVAILAPLLANDRPILARFRGQICFPAFTTYVDSWVPWRSLRNDLKSWKVGYGFPLSDHYPALGDRSWKSLRGTSELGFALWPPVPWHPSQIDKATLKLRPSVHSGHLLGTDDQGRDVLSRLIHGTVVAMTVGVIAMGLASFIGVSLGLLAGYASGRVDLVLSRLTEVVMTFPTFFLIIAVIAFLEPSSGVLASEIVFGGGGRLAVDRIVFLPVAGPCAVPDVSIEVALP